jgi:hypothetical protein
MALWIVTAATAAAGQTQSTDEAITAFPSVGEVEASELDDGPINLLLMPESFEDDPEILLVQREEPVTGETEEERTLRSRATRGQPGTAAAPYSFRQPYSYGPNSLLPGVYGLYGGYGTSPTTGKRWYVSIAQTADYVTNLALPLVVTPNNALFPLEDDYQFQTNVYAQYRIFGNERHSLTTAFNYYQSLHPDVQELDLWAYSWLAQYNRALTDNITAFVNYAYSYYLLDHDPFLNRSAGGAGLAVRTRCRTTWIGSFNLGDNEFRQDATQNAITNFWQIQRVQYFGRNANNYVLAGYAYGDNDADLAGWAYDLHSLFLGGGIRFGCCQRNELFLLGTYGNYQYRGPDPISPPTVREDDVWNFAARLSRSVTTRATVFAQYAYFNSNSNLARQDFDSSLYSVGAVVGF